MNRRHFVAGLLVATSPFAITHTMAQPAPAPGAMPAPQYLAMASKGGLFLEETARDGFAKTQNPAVKRFARAEVNEQVNLADKLDARAPQMAGMAPTPVGVVGGLVAAPFAVAGAAVGTAAGVLGAPGAAMTSDAQKAEMVARLRAMPPGPQYDAKFVQVQLTGHQEALAVHGTYAQSGDDPGLRQVARSALPLIRLHISQLSRMQSTMGGAQS